MTLFYTFLNDAKVCTGPAGSKGDDFKNRESKVLSAICITFVCSFEAQLTTFDT